MCVHPLCMIIQISPCLYIKHLSGLVHSHKQARTDTRVATFMALMLFLMALLLPLHIDVISIRLGLWAFLVEAGAQDSSV